MSIVVAEKPDSRSFVTGGKNPTIDLEFLITGSSSDADVKAALVTESPAMWGGLVRKTASVDPVNIDGSNEDNCIWEGVVHYVLPEKKEDPPETGDSSFSFDTGGGSQHITNSIQTVHSYPNPGAPSFDGAINVTDDGVQGVDITVPVYNFSETHILSDATVTTGYKYTLFSLTGKTNNDSFKGFAPGECLFLGAAGSKRGEGDWEVHFKFAASLNANDITIGSITGIVKKGWEYLWVRYKDKKDSATNIPVKVPASVYVEQVYKEGNMANLEIGT